MKCFTVFTPTFNRAHTLTRVFDSLAAQTFRDFEWLIVDDGSSDGTDALVEEFKRKADFPVRYVYQHNQGKHVAFNHAVNLAHGALFLPLDSDDACVSEALQTFWEVWQSIPAAERSGFTGVCALVTDQFGNIVGEPFPADVLDSDSLEIIHRYRLCGEKWGFHRTAVLREFPFPVIAGQSFMPELVVWGRIARKYKERFINVPLRIYFSEETGRTDQITQSPVWKSAPARLFGHVSSLNERLDWFFSDPVFFIRAAANVTRIGLHANVGFAEQARRLMGPFAHLLWLACLPVGMLLHFRDLQRKRALSQG